jgi:hypothetical protein
MVLKEIPVHRSISVAGEGDYLTSCKEVCSLDHENVATTTHAAQSPFEVIFRVYIGRQECGFVRYIVSPLRSAIFSKSLQMMYARCNLE